MNVLIRGMKHQGVRLQRLSDQVAEIIKARILSGAFRPGERLLEFALTKELGVARSSVREALIELEHWGFVQRIPNRETRVTKLTEEDVLKIFQVREPLELTAIGLVITRLNRGDNIDLSEVERVFAEMNSAIDRQDWESAWSWDREFHSLIWRLAGNEFLYEALERVFVRSCTYSDVLLAQYPQSTHEPFFGEDRHQEIMLGLRNRSLEIAARGVARMTPDMVLAHRKLLEPLNKGKEPPKRLPQKQSSPGFHSKAG
jgi:DNA-binding GntR family transcriptional regulator